MIKSYVTGCNFNTGSISELCVEITGIFVFVCRKSDVSIRATLCTQKNDTRILIPTSLPSSTNDRGR